MNQFGVVRALVGLRDVKKASSLVREAEHEADPLKRKTAAKHAIREIMRASLAPGGHRKKRALRAMAKRAVFAMTRPGRGRGFKRHDGTMGDVTAQNLVREAEWACKFLMVGKQGFANGEMACALDAFFKAASIATSIIFTANTHDLDLPDKVYEDMNCIITDSTHGIKHVKKAIMAKGVRHHEKDFHRDQPVRSHAAAMLRRLAPKVKVHG